MTGEPESVAGAEPEEAPLADTILEHLSKGGLTLRVRIRWVSGEAGRAVAVAQGRALKAALDVLGDVEVGQAPEE